MASDELKELVFATNSTLIQTLNNLDVVDIANINNQVLANTNDIETLQADTIRFQQQLDTLGITLFNYQADTNANFVTVNGQIAQLQNQVGQIPILEQQVTDLNNQVVALSAEVANLEQQVSDIPLLRAELDSLTAKVNQIDSLVTDLVGYTSGLEGRIQDNEEQIANINSGGLGDVYAAITTLNPSGINCTRLPQYGYSFSYINWDGALGGSKGTAHPITSSALEDFPSTYGGPFLIVKSSKSCTTVNEHES